MFQNAFPPLAFVQSLWLFSKADSSADVPKLQEENSESRGEREGSFVGFSQG
jgi:hypothetical protein